MSFPERFAVVRNQSYRGPCFQLLQAERVFNHPYFQGNEDTHYVVSNVDGVTLDRLPLHRMSMQPISVDTRIYTLRYKHPTAREIHEVYYWYLPFEFSSNRRIPILEFQYRSWIPTGYRPIEINMNTAEFLDVLSVVQEERLAAIRRMEDEQRSRRNGIYPHAWGPDDYDSRMIEDPSSFVGVVNRRRSSMRTPTPPRERRIVERVVERVVEVPVERVVVQTRIQPLPRPMAKVLLENARKGSDSCPISTVPFPECSRISMTSCFHFFDTDSLAKWQESHSTCPVCRERVQTVVSEE